MARKPKVKEVVATTVADNSPSSSPVLAHTKSSQSKKSAKKDSKPNSSKSNSTSSASASADSSSAAVPSFTDYSSLPPLFSFLLSSPELFFLSNHELSHTLFQRTKSLYDQFNNKELSNKFGIKLSSTSSSSFNNNNNNNNNGNSIGKSNQKKNFTNSTNNNSTALEILSNLLIDGFTSEQIWEQLKLYNSTINTAAEQLVELEPVNEEETKENSNEEDDEEEFGAEEFSESSEEVDGDGDEEFSDASEVAREEAEEAELEELLDEELEEEEREAELEKKSNRKSAKGKADKAKSVKFSDDIDEWEENEKDGEEEENEDDEEEEDEEESAAAGADADPSNPTTVTDDEFFNFSEMEKFADEFDDENFNDEEIDLGEEIGAVDVSKAEKYSDFFDAPKKGQKKQSQSIEQGMAEEDAEEYASDDEWGGLVASLAAQRREKVRKSEVEKFVVLEKEQLNQMSTFERQQYQKSKEIAELEKKILAPRDWTQMGEKTARDRPQDSLLKETLEYDKATKEKEMITEQVSEQIEDIIKRRILDGLFNDPIIKSLIGVGEKEFKYKEELSTNRPELGLAEQYEMEIRESENKSAGKKSKSEEMKSKEYGEISLLFAQLCHQLDSLANFHFKPKPPRLELTVEARDEPAFQFEESTPAIQSLASTAAPNELYKPKSRTGIESSNAEQSKEEKKRRRQRRKDSNKKQKIQKTTESNNTAQWNQLTSGDQPLDENLGGRGKEFNRIGGRKKIDAKEIQSATKARNVKRGVETDATQYSRSADFFSLINQVEKDAKQEEKSNKRAQKEKSK